MVCLKNREKGENRVAVDEFNCVKGVNAVYAVGDVALMTGDKNYPEGHPQLAQGAIQQGKLLAKNLKRRLVGKEMIPFSIQEPWNHGNGWAEQSGR